MLYTLYYAILNIIERLIVVVIFNTDRMTASRAGLGVRRDFHNILSFAIL